jgi:hypothetical protein
MKNQLSRGKKRRLMYLEHKSGLINGAHARIGWVTFSKTGQSVHYGALTLAKARTASGNFIDPETGDEYWVSGVKKRGSNSHPGERSVNIVIDDDALTEFAAIRANGKA